MFRFRKDKKIASKLAEQRFNEEVDSAMTREESEEILAEVPEDWKDQYWFIEFDLNTPDGIKHRRYPKCKFQMNYGDLKIFFTWPDGSPGEFFMYWGKYMNLSILPHDPKKLNGEKD